MKSADARQGVLGVLAALVSILLVFGSLTLSLVEGEMYVASAPTLSITKTPTASLVHPSETSSTQAATSMVTLVISLTPLPTPSVTPSPLPPPPPSSCPPPNGWSPITIQIGDTLKLLAQTYNVTKELLAQANCLVTDALIAGTTLYVPGYPTPPPPIVCGPPAGWVYYIVQPGDTLYKLSLIYRVSVTQLQLANCLGTSIYIRVGQRLYVPFYIAPTATRAPTLVPTSTPKLTSTSTATVVPTSTSTLPVGFTPAPTATSTSTLTPTATNTPTLTATVTATPTATATSTATNTPSPTATSTFTPTFTPTPGLIPDP